MKNSYAKRLVCPFIQTMESQIKSVPAPKVDSDESSNIKCIGNKCMAWQNTDEGGTLVEVTSAFGYCKLIDKK